MQMAAAAVDIEGSSAKGQEAGHGRSLGTGTMVALGTERGTGTGRGSRETITVRHEVIARVVLPDRRPLRRGSS